jgi:predicted MFS family arabinose efflux permease
MKDFVNLFVLPSLLFVSGFIFLTYSYFSVQLGYRKKVIAEKTENALLVIAWALLLFGIGTLIGCLFIGLKWYFAILLIVVSFVMAYFLSILFKRMSYIAAILLVVAYVTVEILKFVI